MSTKVYARSHKFEGGRLVATPAAINAIADAGQTPMFFLARHFAGDWGEVGKEDAAANDASIVDGSRLLSAYKTLLGERLWIITEAADDNGQRSATTILLPEEY